MPLAAEDDGLHAYIIDDFDAMPCRHVDAIKDSSPLAAWQKHNTSHTHISHITSFPGIFSRHF